MAQARLLDANRLFHEDRDHAAGPAERHDWHEVLVCEDQGYAVEIDGTWHEGRPGAVFHHPAGRAHRPRIHRGCSLVVVRWHEEEPGEDRPRLPDDPQGRLAALAAWLVDEQSGHIDGTPPVAGHLLQALVALLDAAALVGTEESLPVRVVLRHMRYHFAEPLDLASLARLAHLSPWHLLRRFKAEVGETPMATLRRIRLQAAADLLRAGRPLGQVVGACGYRNARALARALRRTTGRVPRELRPHRIGHE